ncbi:MAG: hypothetical protein DRJ37_01860 [Thermoprotei archaeon]|nr:MAG: hypothetical protein DRJ37_01860 [Thermoprotei archaeon]
MVFRRRDSWEEFKRLMLEESMEDFRSFIRDFPEFCAHLSSVLNSLQNRLNVIEDRVSVLEREVESLSFSVKDFSDTLEDLSSQVEKLAGIEAENFKKLSSDIRRLSARVAELDKNFKESREVRVASVDAGAAAFLASLVLKLRSAGLLAFALSISRESRVDWEYVRRKRITVGDVLDAIYALKSGRRNSRLISKNLLKVVDKKVTPTALLQGILYQAF